MLGRCQIREMLLPSFHSLRVTFCGATGHCCPNQESAVNFNLSVHSDRNKENEKEEDICAPFMPFLDTFPTCY